VWCVELSRAEQGWAVMGLLGFAGFNMAEHGWVVLCLAVLGWAGLWACMGCC
jgi:hypothetical protein